MFVSMGQRVRKERNDIVYKVPGKRIQFRWVPIELCEWMDSLAKPLGCVRKNGSYVAWVILHRAMNNWREEGRSFSLQDQWAKYRYNGHRRVSIYVDVPLGEWIEEVASQQHRSLNYAVVSILKEAHNRYIEHGITPELTYPEHKHDAQEAK